jgi:hypothetical protein
MDKLLAAVLDAHGGLQEWAKAVQLTARMSLGGPFWAARGWPGVYDDVTVTIDTRRQHIAFAPFTAPDRLSSMSVGPERVAITDPDGKIIEERADPRSSFPTEFNPTETPWDAIQVAYFTSAAVWNYMVAPFVFAQPDVDAREIEPWIEGSKTWRRLAVAFPKTNANHNTAQTFYYDEAFMLARMDYSPDVTGKPPVAHYTSEYRKFDGFMFPTRRRVHLHDEHGVADQQFAPITIDVTEVRINRSQ